MPAISLIVPTYRRPDRLEECLSAISTLRMRPFETIVVRRSEDLAARAVLDRAPLLCEEVVVSEPGVLAAMVAGADAARGDIIGFLDDDAAPEPDWLSQLSHAFGAEDVGAACGRDRVFVVDDLPIRDQVGHISRFGRIVGNHHLGGGRARQVAVLKGANLLVRRQALALPLGLRGAGAQVHFEVATCLFASRAGWTLVYDPTARVDHLPGPRFDADRRGDVPEPRAVSDAAHNLTSVLLNLEPRQAIVHLAYGVLVGDRGNPGIARAAYAFARGDSPTALKVLPSLRGRFSALTAYLAGRRVRMVVFPMTAS